jgi:hypothetical protein
MICPAVNDGEGGDDGDGIDDPVQADTLQASATATVNVEMTLIGLLIRSSWGGRRFAAAPCMSVVRQFFT